MTAPCTRYLVTINESRFILRRHGEEQGETYLAPKLSPGDTLSIKGDEVLLGDLSHALIHYDQDWIEHYLDERGQIEVGHYLYKQIFAEKTPQDLATNCEPVEVRIITTDENISRLPWVLLAHGPDFLSTMGWSVTLATSNRIENLELPPKPRILVVAPQADGQLETEAEPHIRDLRDLLSAADPTYSGDSHIRVVTDFITFSSELTTFQPEILYYYGHGIGNEHTSRLIFADHRGRAQERPLLDLVMPLRSLPENQRPLLAYINCCQGDSGGLLGAGMQLIGHIPAVVTNRTTAYIDAARGQAMMFFDHLLLRGQPPQSALAATRGALGSLDLTTADIRWMTPLLYCRYDQWIANPPTRPERTLRDPDWRLKVDRVNQFSKVFFQTHQMLMERKPRGLAYLWYGTPDQGGEIFHSRLNVELQEKLVDTVLYKREPVWPEDDLTADPARSFSEMLCHAFEVDTLKHIPGRIRNFSRGVSGKRVLVYLCHSPIVNHGAFKPRNIKLYLNWWSRNFIPELPENAHTLLGISCQAADPSKLYRFLTNKQKLNDLYMDDAVFTLLDKLDRVTRNDLLDFIRTHNILVPNDLRDKELDAILARSDGVYVRILDELENLESRIWRAGVEVGAITTDDDDDDSGLLS